MAIKKKTKQEKVWAPTHLPPICSSNSKQMRLTIEPHYSFWTCKGHVVVTSY